MSTTAPVSTSVSNQLPRHPQLADTPTNAASRTRFRGRRRRCGSARSGRAVRPSADTSFHSVNLPDAHTAPTCVVHGLYMICTSRELRVNDCSPTESDFRCPPRLRPARARAARSSHAKSAGLRIPSHRLAAGGRTAADSENGRPRERCGLHRRLPRLARGPACLRLSGLAAGAAARGAGAAGRGPLGADAPRERRRAGRRRPRPADRRARRLRRDLRPRRAQRALPASSTPTSTACRCCC